MIPTQPVHTWPTHQLVQHIGKLYRLASLLKWRIDADTLSKEQAELLEFASNWVDQEQQDLKTGAHRQDRI